MRYKRNETICWSCENCTRCSWSKGVPVEGWEATPTKIINNTINGEPLITNSFCVHKCPHFKDDKLQKVSIKKLGSIINRGAKSIYRLLEKKNGCAELKKLALERGYKLYIYDGSMFKVYYVEKLL